MKNILIFVAGAAVGSLVTWKLLESKYEKRAQDESCELRNYYKNRYSGPENSDDTEETTDESIEDYKNIVNNYTDEVNDSTESTAKPYIISEELFGEKDGYEVIGLTLYSDGHLADDDDRLIEDIENTVGDEAIKYFDKYDEDSVYVRNDRLKTDFEIVLSLKPYSGVLMEKPYLMEDVDVEDS